ncbi:MAG: hypothetical protein RQ736_04515 [Thiogranum sp.]|nr:hypothetical protein [Thiogranum sp.]
MNSHDHIDEKTLGAFVDGQLNETDRSSVIRALDASFELREQVYQLRRATDLVKLGFGGATSSAAKPPSWRIGLTRRHAFALAASVAMLGIGFSAGSLDYSFTGSGTMQAGQAMQELSAAPVPQQTNHVVLHIEDSDPRQFIAALNYVDTFLQQYAGGGGEIEVVANAGGLDMMRSGLSPYEQRVVDMINRHGNVSFVACSNAIRNLELQGIEPGIISNVDTDETALQHIVARLQSGWTYVKAESLVDASHNSAPAAGTAL